jgi:hypothetical protein
MYKIVPGGVPGRVNSAVSVVISVIGSPTFDRAYERREKSTSLIQKKKTKSPPLNLRVDGDARAVLDIDQVPAREVSAV